ncbi:hypothetical protein Nepgr_012418 [Nepenthes gracilis]|uniref:Uncharacterized protein n=1 Tax=Nepenthes gracilis TaxID=150966 RepID=A0AAD3SHA4_NEPGR|nr:hypothetical protein Nepgr_012418 [Nepenthes gracilis]
MSLLVEFNFLSLATVPGGCIPSSDGPRWHLHGFELLSDIGLVLSELQFFWFLPVHVGLKSGGTWWATVADVFLYSVCNLVFS